MNQTRRVEQPVPTLLLGDVLWRTLDGPGMEHCRFMQVAAADAPFVAIHGTILTLEGGRPFRADYLVQCDASWTTRAVHVNATHGNVHLHLKLERDEGGQWSRDGEPLDELSGLEDVDLSITPATNTLPIRRMGLAPGASDSTDAVWVRFPELAISRLPQRYTRTGEREYLYESRGGSFSAILEVDDAGIVTRYDDLWERVSP